MFGIILFTIYIFLNLNLTIGLDFLLPDGDDYKLVFISSDSSSKEEDVDDNDSSSTASRLVEYGTIVTFQ